jgi:hypothetical protein
MTDCAARSPPSFRVETMAGWTAQAGHAGEAHGLALAGLPWSGWPIHAPFGPGRAARMAADVAVEELIRSSTVLGAKKETRPHAHD